MTEADIDARTSSMETVNSRYPEAKGLPQLTRERLAVTRDIYTCFSIGSVVETYDNFMSRYGFTWNEAQRQYVPTDDLQTTETE